MELDHEYAAEKYGEAAKTCMLTLATLSTYKKEYVELDSVLSTLPDTLHPKIMVPLGPLAFMPGHLNHTNEILVLLGENYFVKRSAQQARSIISRRIKHVDEHISKTKQELDAFQKHEELASSLSKDQGDLGSMVENEDGTVEIMEPIGDYDDDDDDDDQQQQQQQQKSRNLPDDEIDEDERIDALERQFACMSQYLDDDDDDVPDEEEVVHDNHVQPAAATAKPVVLSPADIYQRGMLLKHNGSTPIKETVAERANPEPVSSSLPSTLPSTSSSTTTQSTAPMSRFRREMQEKKAGRQ